MMLKLTIINRKGGVAKTTSALNLAAELAARGLRVLTCDTDPQATLSMAAGYPNLNDAETIAALLCPDQFAGSEPARPKPAPWGGDILAAPGHPGLSDVEVLLLQPSVLAPNQRLARVLSRFDDDYDICLIDTPPSLGRLAVNALTAADYLLIPLSPDFFSAGGLALMRRTIEDVREQEKPGLEVLGIFATQTRQTMHAREWRLELARGLGEEWIDIAVPLAVSIQDAQQSGKAVRDYDPDGKGAHAYRRIVDEILDRLGRRGHLLIQEKAVA